MPQNLWNETAAQQHPELDGLVYRSNLLGSDRTVVNIYGGNTSAKLWAKNHLGQDVEVLWVKGSGSDVATITEKGFAGLRQAEITPLLARAQMSDEEMVAYLTQCTHAFDRPRQSIETLLHAFLPHKFIDHTHANPVLALCDQPNGEALCREVFGARVALEVAIGAGTQPCAIFGRLGDAAEQQQCVRCAADQLEQPLFTVLADFLHGVINGSLPRAGAVTEVHPAAQADGLLAQAAMGHAVGVILIDNRAPAVVDVQHRQRARHLALHHAQRRQQPQQRVAHPLRDRAVQRQQIVQAARRRIGRFQKLGGHRHALGFIRFKQDQAPPLLLHQRQLPGQVKRILHAGVHPLSRRRTVGMRGVAGQKDAVDAVVRRHAAVNRVLVHPQRFADAAARRAA